MRTSILQELTTVKGTVTITQDESGWIEGTDAQDLVVFLDIRSVSGTATIVFQTSPTKDDALFQTMTTGTTIAVTVTTVKILLSSAAVPPARWVRWQIQASGAWDSTFRAYIAINGK